MFKGFNNGQFPPNMTPEMYAYMLQGSMGLGNQGYTMPFYNSFESAMNNPSNPLVNPTNAMNPLQYNQSLFGPNVTPMMSQNMCKNSSADKSEKIREDVKEDDKSKDNTINSSLGSNNVLNSTFDKLNSSANTMLAQNTGDEGKATGGGSRSPARFTPKTPKVTNVNVVPQSGGGMTFLPMVLPTQKSKPPQIPQMQSPATEAPNISSVNPGNPFMMLTPELYGIG